MSDTLLEQLPETADRLLETAERCYRLARAVTDRQTCEKLLEIAQECEEKAEMLTRGS